MGIGYNPLRWPGYAYDYATGNRPGGISGGGPGDMLKKAAGIGESRDVSGSLGKIGAEADKASAFAGRGEREYSILGAEAQADRARLRRIATGEESVSAMQLKSALGRNIAGQQAMAAGARPSNAAMAARTAAMQAGRLGAGLAGQQAIAGIQERQAAAGQLGQLTLGARGQDLQAALGGRDQALKAHTSVFTGEMGQPTESEQWRQLAMTGAQLYAMSDERIKEDIEDGDQDAEALLRGLKAHTFKYKDSKHGEGRQLGIMAQTLEKLAPHAVMDTPEGKAVHGAKLATALASTLPVINRRLEELESGKGRKKRGK